MQRFVARDERFLKANSDLKEGKQLASKADKMAKAAKAFVLDWLKTERNFDVAAQPVGTVCLIELEAGDSKRDCFKVEVKGRNAVDLSRLELEQPEVAAKYRGEKPAVYIDAL